MLTALNAAGGDQAAHPASALNNGVTVDEIKEVMLQAIDGQACPPAFEALPAPRTKCSMEAGLVKPEQETK